MSWDAWENLEAAELPPFTDDEIAVYEALDRLWCVGVRTGRAWVTPDVLHRACPQLTPRTVGHHVVWLHIQHLVAWDIGGEPPDVVGYAPTELATTVASWGKLMPAYERVTQLHPTPVTGRILNGSFAMITNDVSMNPKIPPSARLLYVILVAKAGRTGWCDDSLDALGIAYGASARQIQRLLDELLRHAVILERPNRAGRGRSKIYAPIMGLTESRLREVLAFVSQPRHPVTNTTEMSYWPSAAERPNTTFLATDMSCLEPSNTTDLSSLPDSLIDTPVDRPETAMVPPAPASQLENPAGESGAPKPLLPVPKPTSPLPDAVKAQVREIWDYYRAKIQPKARVHNPKTIARRLETFTVEEIKAGIDHFAADWWRMKNNASNGADWFFESDKQVDKWVTLVPRPPEGSEPHPSRPQQGAGGRAARLAGCADLG